MKPGQMKAALVWPAFWLTWDAGPCARFNAGRLVRGRMQLTWSEIPVATVCMTVVTR